MQRAGENLTSSLQVRIIILLIDYGAPRVGGLVFDDGPGMGLSILMPKLTKLIRKSVCTAASRVAVRPKVKLV